MSTGAKSTPFNGLVLGYESLSLIIFGPNMQKFCEKDGLKTTRISVKRFCLKRIRAKRAWLDTRIILSKCFNIKILDKGKDFFIRYLVFLCVSIENMHRSDEPLNRIREYIVNNPVQWKYGTLLIKACLFETNWVYIQF